MLGQIASLFERPTVARAPLSEKMHGVNLFLVGFLVLLQTTESKHINLRALIKRLVRRMICFFKTITLRDLMIGLLIKSL